MARRTLILLVVLLVLSGCAGRVSKPAPQPAPPSSAVKPVPPSGIPSAPLAKPPASLVRLPADQHPFFADDMDLASLEKAIEKSLQYYGRAAGNGPRPMDDTVVTVRELKESLIALRGILRRDEPDEMKQTRIRETFDVYQSTGLDGKNTVLFTGYFEPVMDGSPKKTAKYQYPIYKTPNDAVVVNLPKFNEKYPGEQLIGRVKNGELIPYYTRSEIEDLGSLAGRNLEIAWVDDRIALFFLHTQGSGKIKLPNGKLLQIGYALKTDAPSRA